MRNSRTVLVVLTGAVLAFVIWLVIVFLQRGNKTPVANPAPEMTTNSILERYTIAPATVTSGTQKAGQILLSGLGETNASVELVVNTNIVSSAVVDTEGVWLSEVELERLTAREIVEIYMTLLSGDIVRSDQVLVVVKSPTPNDAASGDPALIFLTAPGAQSSILQTPYGAAPGRDGFYLDAIDYDNSGGVIFSGTSVKRGKVGIFASGNLVGESSVDATGRWSLIFGNIMPLGAYDISAELMPTGETSPIRIDLPFERMTPLFQNEGSPKIKVEMLTDRIQVARSILGGGYQYTVIYAPEAVEN